MKATMIEFNDDGKIIKKQTVEYMIAWGERNPTINIDLPDRTKTRHQSIDIPLKQFMYLFEKQKNSKRIIKMRKGFIKRKKK